MLSTLTPAQLTNAYGVNAITFTSPSGSTIVGDGTGETIALIEAYHDPTLVPDLQVFDLANYLADPQLSVVNQAGTKTNSQWAAEESLDTEWAHAIAPGANILVVEARSQDLPDLVAAVDTARHTPGVVAISMSWGFNESSNESSYDAVFSTPAGHAGITFIAASGDSGSLGGAEYPSTSPDVLSVGGTTLNLDLNGDYLCETAWTDSGGGYSRYEAEPSYQKSLQSTGHRSTPDVAFDGDPNTGVGVYETPLHGGQGLWQTVGGTSLGAPAWAAIVAIADQGGALAGKGSLDGPTQTLPTLYALTSTDFHAIAAQGHSPLSNGGGDLFGFLPFGGILLRHRSQSVRGWNKGTSHGANTATGLGSPQAPPLIADLAASTITAPMPNATTPSSPPSASPRGGAGSRHHHSSQHRHTVPQTQPTTHPWVPRAIHRVRPASSPPKPERWALPR
jgi:hypothetical protein